MANNRAKTNKQNIIASGYQSLKVMRTYGLERKSLSIPACRQAGFEIIDDCLYVHDLVRLLVTYSI